MLRRFASMLDAKALPLPVQVPDLSRPLPPHSERSDAVRHVLHLSLQPPLHISHRLLLYALHDANPVVASN